MEENKATRPSAAAGGRQLYLPLQPVGSSDLMSIGARSATGGHHSALWAKADFQQLQIKTRSQNSGVFIWLMAFASYRDDRRFKRLKSAPDLRINDAARGKSTLYDDVNEEQVNQMDSEGT